MRLITRAWIASLLIAAAACHTLTGDVSTPSVEELKGVWRVQSMAGRQVAADSRTRIEFSAPPRLTGNASCNRFFGVYGYREGQLRVDENIGAGKMLCRPSLMAQENEFLSLLPRSTRIQIHNGNLEVFDARGELLIRARRQRDTQR